MSDSSKRVLYVVQRYGTEVAGGAEALARQFAEQLTTRRHQVSVLTSCALDYQTWTDHYAPGTTVESGVSVHRLSVPRPRDASRFGPLSGRVFGDSPAPVVQDAWMQEQGPILDGFTDRLRELAAVHDVVVFMTYLYPTTVLGLASIAPFVPTILHPTAHEEAPMRLPMIRADFDHATAIAYSTPEEQTLVDRRFRPTAVSSVIGIGFNTEPPVGDSAKFRATYGLGNDPYLLLLGRIDPNKAADEAVELVRAYRRIRGSSLRLVLVGEPAMTIPDDHGIVVTGFVDDAVRWDALAGCIALLQPSYQESFSMVLAEAWSAGVPGLVQRQCDVLAGFAERSHGALAYSRLSEFVTCVDLLLDQPELRSELGRNGQRHVKENFSWDAVMYRYESLFDASVEAFGSARAASSP